MSDRFPITGIPRDGFPDRALVVGDPARVRKVGALLEGTEAVAENREYTTVVGSWNGIDVGVTSHGVGTAGAAACFTELLRAGAERLIRAGTCGGLQPQVTDGDLVVVSGAVRDDGYSRGVVPLEFPAVAHADIVAALRAAAPHAHLGIVLTSDVFYPFDVLGSNLSQWQRAGCVAVEMECAALFVAASLAGARAGAILAVDGNPLAAEDDSMADYDPHRDVVSDAVGRMLTAALDALVA